VRRGEIKLGHQRLTVYEFTPPEEAPATVVEFAAAERRRG
jgi:hypothetical protein